MSRSSSLANSSKGGRRFLVAIAVVSVLWLAILPSLQQLGSVQSYIERMKAAGINPSAVYYTEHPSTRDWERTMLDQVARNRDAFWSSTHSK